MRRIPFHTAALLLAGAAAVACDHPVATAPSTRSLDDAIVRQLDAVGYRGPVIVAQRTATDGRGIGGTTRRLFLPAGGIALVRHADPAKMRPLLDMLQAAEITDPNQIDTPHNSQPGDLGHIVQPSRLNGNNAVQSQVNYTMQFYSYNYTTNQWYLVQSGTVNRSYIRARDSSSGHWHGSADTNQLHLPARVGTLVPPTGTIAAGSWATQWKVPEVSNEVSFTFNVTEIGGPNDGQTDWFYSLQNDADRFTGLQRIGAGTGHYRRTGGTGTHPEAFNDWGTADIISRIGKADSAYWSKTHDSTLVNDISLFYGGKFDVGRSINHVLNDCTDAATQYCWQFSHYEHRIGTEVDIKNKAWADSAGKRVTFLNVLRNEFKTVFIEGNHYHARGAGSPYPVK